MNLTDEQFTQLIAALRGPPDPFQVNGRVLGLALAVLMLIGGWMVKSQNKLAEEFAAVRTDVAVIQREIAVVDGNRFTVADALQMRREIESGPPNAGAMSMFQGLESRIQRLEGFHNPGGSPP